MSALHLTDLDATAALAGAVSPLLTPGAVVLLTGDLGAGKTTFTKALAAALDVDDEVTSPTFTIMTPHPAAFAFGPGTLLHLDAYRLGGPHALDEIGIFELLDDGAVAVIEWGDLVASAFPDALTLSFTVNDDDTRDVEVTGASDDVRAHISTTFLARVRTC